MMANRRSLGLAATLVLVGEVVVTVVVLFLHPGGGSTVEETFANDAASTDWVGIHLAQFLGMAALLSGLLVLIFALGLPVGAARWVGFFAAGAAGVALALVGVVFAVDGVANKQAVDAWAQAPTAQKPARLAVAQGLRWVEIGATSYSDMLLGLALVLTGVVIVWTARVAVAIGYLDALSGLAFIVAGWLIGTRGFTSADTLPTNLAYTSLFVAMIWLLVIAFRGSERSASVPEPRGVMGQVR